MERELYNGGLGANPPAGSRDRAPGGVKLKESFLALQRPTKPQNLPSFLAKCSLHNHVRGKRDFGLLCITVTN